MGLFLHLSDIHLGQTPEDEIADDYKHEFVPVEQRVQRQQILMWTLEALQRVLEGPFDAVVVSGDLTVANREDGFRQFEELMNALGPLRPGNDKIVVVPGNHDVTRHTSSGSAERYELFNRYVREEGYVSPLLDGIDIDDAGRFVGDRKYPHSLMNEAEGWVIVPINSSDYSVSLEPLPHVPPELWQATVDDIRTQTGEEAALEVQRLREYDAARVSPAQLQALDPFSARSG